MAGVYSLRYQDWQCDVVPEKGGCLTGLWKANVPLLRVTPRPLPLSALDSASYPLVPYSNRIADAQLAWDGAHYRLEKNFLPEPHAIHGVGWMQPWAVLASNEREISLSLRHTSNAAWPFDFCAEQFIRLGHTGLTLGMSVCNESTMPMPAGLGWHPYFVKRANGHIRFDATGRWDMGADQLPTYLARHNGLDLELADLQVDHCFEGWNGELVVSDRQVVVTLRSGFQRLVVYTTPDLDAIAIEPVSHANNAYNLAGGPGRQADAMGICVLPAGARFSGEMQIDASIKV